MTSKIKKKDLISSLNLLEAGIRDGYGDPCWSKKYSKKNRGFNFNCAICQTWMAIEILRDHIECWEDD